jgi:hypothetical protein
MAVEYLCKVCRGNLNVISIPRLLQDNLFKILVRLFIFRAPQDDGATKYDRYFEVPG